jgi:Fusaric acid resistance protein-like
VGPLIYLDLRSIGLVADPHRTLSERAQPLLEEAAERSRLSARARAERLRDTARAILQATLAATLAWLVATEIVGHSQPFFAPVSAMITLGLTQGERGRRAVEVVLGVTLGIAVADLLVLGLGTGWWQLALVVALSMSIALLLGSGQMFAQQAAVSAALVATLQPPDGGLSFARAVDALLGGSIALAISALVLPAHPGRIVREAAAPVLAELAGVLEDIAAALTARSREDAQAALARGRGIDELARNLDRALVVGRETVWLAPPRRRLLGTVDLYADAAVQIDLAVRNVRVLARGARRAIDLDDNVPPEVADSLRELAAAVRGLGEALDDPDRVDAVREPALRAAGKATLVLERTGNMSVSVIVGQVRSTAVDLLRGSGMSYDEAAEAVRGAVWDED